MRRCLGLLSLTASLGCSSAPPFASHRLADGSYELACQLPLAQCLDRVDELCAGTPYDVVSAHDRRRPIDVQLGSDQREVRSSDAIVRCTRNKPFFGGHPEPKEVPQPVAKPGSVCIPGATQVCVGPGACAGGQACLADGSRFGPCNCAPAPAPSDAGVDR